MKLYSNEIVFRGHPDKVCDQISDTILDECLKKDLYEECKSRNIIKDLNLRNTCYEEKAKFGYFKN